MCTIITLFIHRTLYCLVKTDSVPTTQIPLLPFPSLWQLHSAMSLLNLIALETSQSEVMLISLSIMSSRLICVVACFRIPFLFEGYIIFHHMDRPHLYLLIMKGPLGGFHLLAIANNAACRHGCTNISSIILLSTLLWVYTQRVNCCRSYGDS